MSRFLESGEDGWTISHVDASDRTSLPRVPYGHIRKLVHDRTLGDGFHKIGMPGKLLLPEQEAFSPNEAKRRQTFSRLLPADHVHVAHGPQKGPALPILSPLSYDRSRGLARMEKGHPHLDLTWLVCHAS